RRNTPVRKIVPKHPANCRPQHEQQHQPLPRLLSGLSVHGRPPCPPTSTSSFSGAGTDSNTEFAEPNVTRRVKSSRLNCTAHVVPTTSNTKHSATSRGASRRIPIHTPLLRSSCSFSLPRIAAITRAVNHGPGSATAVLSGSSAPRVSTRSSTALPHSAHTAACPRASLDICAKTDGAVASPASFPANPSSSSRKCRHSLFFISSSLVIRGPFSSLLPIFPSAPPSLLPRFQPSPHTLRDLFHRKPFHFLQHQHRSVAFLQALQQLLHPLPPRQLLARIWVPVGNLFCRLVLPRLFLAQVHLQHQRPHFPLPQQVPTFVQRDLVQPRTERRPLIEPF